MSRRTEVSTGILTFRRREKGGIEVLLAHPGGPYWRNRDEGAWSIPKGEYADGDDPWAAAQREFEEEVGLRPPTGPRVDLGSVKQSGGKVVTAFAVHGDLDVTDAHSNTFELEWPRGSGQLRTFPEVDRVGWFPVAHARVKLLKGQVGFLDELMAHPSLAGFAES